MADLAVKLADTSHPGVVTTAAVLFLIAFGIEAGIFPLFFWLPAAYHTPPSAVSALFAGLLTKVGVYALVRMFTLVFTQDVGYTHGLLLGAAGLTMITGVLGAVTQSDFRRVLSFHIVSQIGYMVLGLALFVPLAVAGAVFYIAHHIIVKTNLFLVSGVAQRLRGTYHLADLGGLYRERPLLAGLFLVSALSLAGVPPLSGFFAKLVLVQASLETERYLIAATALAVGLLTLYSMTKIWAEAFWKAAPTDGNGAAGPAPEDSPRGLRLMMAPVAFLAFLTLALGLAPGPMLALSMDAAAQLLDPSDYVRAVLGAAR
jgi:multicomponent Na+:H+ antiporter subunit D